MSFDSPPDSGLDAVFVTVGRTAVGNGDASSEKTNCGIGVNQV